MDTISVNESLFSRKSLNHEGSRFRAKPIIMAASLAVGFITLPAQAALTFTFNYLSDGVGFSDPTYGAARQAALNSAANRLGSYFSSYNANLVYDVTSYSADNSTLASAGSDMYVVPGTFQETLVQAKILHGIDSGGADGVIDWNFFHDWGLTDNPTSDQYDFTSTAMHELLHSFGFSSNIGEDGMGIVGNPPGTADTWSVYDRYLTDSAGNSLISNDGVFNPNRVDALTAGTENSPGVLFNGAHAVAANGGQGVPIYSPSLWEDGSSIAHLDDDSMVTSLSIMNASAHGTGLDVRELGSLELAILQDIGYTEVSAVPVPAAIWLMGSGIVGLFGFSRKQKAA
jgi:hypothetical protein